MHSCTPTSDPSFDLNPGRALGFPRANRHEPPAAYESQVRLVGDLLHFSTMNRGPVRIATDCLPYIRQMCVHEEIRRATSTKRRWGLLLTPGVPIELLSLVSAGSSRTSSLSWSCLKSKSSHGNRWYEAV